MNKRSTALITGITGQDGSYLAELLLSKGYRVVGLRRERKSDQVSCSNPRIQYYSVDTTCQKSVSKLIAQLKPSEFYNLGAQSFVPGSWQDPAGTIESNAMAVLRYLEAIRLGSPETRFFQASSAAMFGQMPESPQSEETPFRPTTPYASSKLLAHNLVENYRSRYSMYAVSGILYNHESPRRGRDFVTQKIACGAARIKLGLQEKLALGNLDVQRDWGHAADFVQAMWQMLQLETPEDFIIATGIPHTVRQLADIAFDCVGLDWAKYVEIDPKFVRKQEDFAPVGNAGKALRVMGWKPQIEFKSMIREMVDAELARLESAEALSEAV